MSAGLTISDSIYARVDGASFGLILSGTELGFATSGGSFDLSLAPLGSVSATSVEITYTNAVTTIDAGTPVGARDVTFEFVEAVAAGTTSFAVEGFAASVVDVVTLAGDADFNMNAQGDITANFDGSLSVSQLFDIVSGVYGFVFDAAAQKTKIAGEDIDFNVKVGDTDLMSFSNGSGALLLSDAGVAGSLSGEVALFDSIPDVTLAADQFTAVFSTIADEVEESIEVGDETFDLTVPGGPFLSLAAEEVTFTLFGELSLEGNILFERQTVADGELMIISFSDVSIAAGFGGEGTGGEALSVTDANGDFVILPGNGVVGRLSFVANVDIPLMPRAQQPLYFQ